MDNLLKRPFYLLEEIPKNQESKFPCIAALCLFILFHDGDLHAIGLLPSRASIL